MRRVVDIVIRAVLVCATLAVMAVLAARLLTWPPVPGKADIAHAGGVIDGRHYTDSIAAADRSQSAGFRIIEIDIEETADGHLVCGHDWHAFDGAAPDLAAFMARRKAFRFPPCTVDELISWARRHPDITLYADIKRDVLQAGAQLAARLAADRLIVEATRPEMVCKLRQVGVRHVVLSTYRRASSYSRLVADLSAPCASQAEAVAIPMARVFRGHALLARAVSGLPVLGHSPHDCVSTRIARVMGADAFFTDLEGPGRC